MKFCVLCFCQQLMHHIYDVPMLLWHMWRALFTLRGLVLLRLTLLLSFLLLYTLSPLDILPEAAFGLLGLLDDLLVILIVLLTISMVYRAHLTNT